MLKLKESIKIQVDLNLIKSIKYVLAVEFLKCLKLCLLSRAVW